MLKYVILIIYSCDCLFIENMAVGISQREAKKFAKTPPNFIKEFV